MFQINLNSQVALDVVHRLFESVAPIVFRPVDILLKTLLMSPADIVSWFLNFIKYEIHCESFISSKSNISFYEPM